MQGEINNAVNSLTAGITRSGFDIARRFLSLVTNLPYFIIYISFLAMGLFFISRDYDDIRSYLPGGKRRRQDSSTTRLTNSAIRSLIGYLRVQGTFSIMVLVVSLIYLHICGFAYAGTISMLAAVLELIPMIGSGLLYILMGIIFLLTGNTAGGIQVLLLTGFLQLVRRILEPKLMSNSIGITPLESLIGMFAGLRFGGIPGLIGGPVMMSIIVGAVRGPAYASLKSDIRCIRLYFQRRWARKPDLLSADVSPDEPEPPDEEE
jgi:predicted PurR-regulated permease PerM